VSIVSAALATWIGNGASVVAMAAATATLMTRLRAYANLVVFISVPSLKTSLYRVW
jgi:hypothetical protein